MQKAANGRFIIHWFSLSKINNDPKSIFNIEAQLLLITSSKLDNFFRKKLELFICDADSPASQTF